MRRQSLRETLRRRGREGRVVKYDQHTKKERDEFIEQGGREKEGANPAVGEVIWSKYVAR